MARTVFVNPRRRRKRAKRRNATITPAALAAARNPRRRRRRARRRNAGITPFVQNPLILSNPRRRRRRAKNPLQTLDLKTMLDKGLTYGSGAAIAVGANALLLNRVDNYWIRNGVRFVGGVVGGAFLKGELGAATAGAMFYPLFQELAAKMLGKSLVTGTEADMDALAADLEDVLDDIKEQDLSDDEDYSDDDDFSGDEEGELFVP